MFDVLPPFEVAQDELAAVVDPDRPRIDDQVAYPLKGLDDILATIAQPRICRRAIARMRVDDRQDAQLPAGCELVMAEVHYPNIV